MSDHMEQKAQEQIEKGLHQQTIMGHQENVLELVQSIFSNADFTVETPNEGALVEYMKVLGYPIEYKKSVRDTESDFEEYCKFHKIDVGVLR